LLRDYQNAQRVISRHSATNPLWAMWGNIKT